MRIVYGAVAQPLLHRNYVPVELNERTMKTHYQKVMAAIEKSGLDALLIYADREHGANFAYLTGYEPRFEESLLVLHKNGDRYVLLGNENLKMARHSFLEARVIHVPHFSLPYQPMLPDHTMKEKMHAAGITDNMKIGCAGWKLFTSRNEKNEELIDLPAFILDAVRACNPNGKVVNACSIFIDPQNGVRITVNANELAHYEFGSGMASGLVMDALNSAEPGKTEMEIAEKMNVKGQPITVTTICASGDRFANAVVFPRNRKIAAGDPFSITLGLRGGLTSRAAYVAAGREDLPVSETEYMKGLVIPYFKTVVSWYEMVGLGVSCADVYEMVRETLPPERYLWTLNPGHLTGQEEWMVSPFFKDSCVTIKSGMMLQMDITPHLSGYTGISAEDGVAIADENLREELRTIYPETWKRIQNRKNYMKKILGINLKKETLPLSDICGYVRPMLLKKGWALQVLAER